MTTYIVSENPSYWTPATTREMLKRGIWVCDLGRIFYNEGRRVRNRAARIVEGRACIVAEDMNDCVDTVVVGDTLQMLVRGEKSVYQGRVLGPPVIRLVNTHEHREGEFYSLPEVVATRRCHFGEPIMGAGSAEEGFGGLSDGFQVEVQIPVEWSRTTIPVSRQPYATIQRVA
jgi:hypothetical protein